MTRILIALSALFAFAACSSAPATETVAPAPNATPATAASTATESAASVAISEPAPTATPTATAGWGVFEEMTSTTASRVAFIGDTERRDSLVVFENRQPALVISCAEFDGGSILAVTYRPKGGVADGESMSVTFAVGEETLTLSGEGDLGAVLFPFERSDDVIDLLLRGTDGVTVNGDEFTLDGYAAAVADVRPCEAQ